MVKSQGSLIYIQFKCNNENFHASYQSTLINTCLYLFKIPRVLNKTHQENRFHLFWATFMFYRERWGDSLLVVPMVIFTRNSWKNGLPIATKTRSIWRSHHMGCKTASVGLLPAACYIWLFFFVFFLFFFGRNECTPIVIPFCHFCVKIPTIKFCIIYIFR